MGTLGQFLRDARTARGIDLREAAQQTRISIQYLQSLEAEDFSKLPGEVFVKGFLKNYGKFLRLDEAEVMQKYGELSQKKPAANAPAARVEPVAVEEPPPPSKNMPIEPFIWGAGIVLVLFLFLFAALPSRRGHKNEEHRTQVTAPTTTTSAELATASAPTTTRPDKLYLEVVALENTWLLVRTDASPQKKATLAKGDSLIWSADERFLLSYGSTGAIKLSLNGKDLVVDEPKNAVVRDLVITASGIVNKKLRSEAPRQAKPKPSSAGTPTTVTRVPGLRRTLESKPTPSIGVPASAQQLPPAPISQEQRTVPQPIAPLVQH